MSYMNKYHSAPNDALTVSVREFHMLNIISKFIEISKNAVIMLKPQGKDWIPDCSLNEITIKTEDFSDLAALGKEMLEAFQQDDKSCAGPWCKYDNFRDLRNRFVSNYRIATGTQFGTCGLNHDDLIRLTQRADQLSDIQNLVFQTKLYLPDVKTYLRHDLYGNWYDMPKNVHTVPLTFRYCDASHQNLQFFHVVFSLLKPYTFFNNFTCSESYTENPHIDGFIDAIRELRGNRMFHPETMLHDAECQLTVLPVNKSNGDVAVPANHIGRPWNYDILQNFTHNYDQDIIQNLSVNDIIQSQNVDYAWIAQQLWDEITAHQPDIQFHSTER